jgi:hypothetical protein
VGVHYDVETGFNRGDSPMTAVEMPRKNAGYRLDERCIASLKVLAARTGKSVNEYLEDLLFTHAKIHEVLPPDAEPLGETRGGKRSGAGKPKKTDPEPED